MAGQKTTWGEIERLYDQEWVELVDYDWREEEAYPRSGIVRVHAKSREEFDDLADINPPADSAYVFVGERRKPSGVVMTHVCSRVILK